MSIKDEIKDKAGKISISLIIILVLFGLVIGGLYYITDEIVLEKEGRFDTTIIHALEVNRGPLMRQVMLFFTFFGSSTFLLPAYILIGAFYFFKQKEISKSLNIAAVGLGSAALLHLLKNIFKRPRPEMRLLKDIAGYSYPSGHSFSSFTLSGLLIYLVWNTEMSKTLKWVWTVVLFLFAFMVAFSRVYFHVHYPSDVIAGLLLSFVWLSCCYYVLVQWNWPARMIGKNNKQNESGNNKPGE